MAKREIHPVIKIWIPVILLLAGSMVLALQFAEEPPPKKVTIATGGTSGAYYKFGNIYKEKFAKEAKSIEFTVVSTGGSVENIKKLEAGEADVAFIQGGVAGAATANSGIQALASVYYEPIWLFYRGAEDMRILPELKGKRIAVGKAGSGTLPVARQILEINGVTSENSDFLELSSDDASKGLASGEVDAAFFVSSHTAPVIQGLIAEAAKPFAEGEVTVRLMNFRRYRAYARNLGFLKEVEIPEGLFDLANNIPKENIVLLSTTATLCARKGLHPAIARLFAQVATEVHSGQGLLEARGEFPTTAYVEFPMNETAKGYLVNGPSWLSRNLPFWAVSWINRLKILLLPLLTLFIPLLKLAPVLYKVGMQKRIYRWYKTLNRIELEMATEQTAAQLDGVLDELEKLASEVAKISVPTGYRKEVYNLRMHIQLITDQTRRRKAELAKKA